MMLPCEERLLAVLQKLKPFGIAFSGGADSTMLAHFSAKYLGRDSFVLVHVKSVLGPGRERTMAEACAAELEAELLEPELDLLSDPDIAANGPLRCYFCKKKIMSSILCTLEKHNMHTLCDGTNTDDLTDYRPGMKAADELGVKHPFLEAGIGKKEIRLMARRLGIGEWNLPASACLASRVPCGTPLSIDVIEQIRDSETLLSEKYKLRGIRVRVLSDKTARLEFNPVYTGRIIRLQNSIEQELCKRGFTHVEFAVYRRGSMNPENLKR